MKHEILIEDTGELRIDNDPAPPELRKAAS